MVKEAIDTSNGKLVVMTENSDNAFMPATINPFYMVCYLSLIHILRLIRFVDLNKHINPVRGLMITDNSLLCP